MFKSLISEAVAYRDARGTASFVVVPLPPTVSSGIAPFLSYSVNSLETDQIMYETNAEESGVLNSDQKGVWRCQWG